MSIRLENVGITVRDLDAGDVYRLTYLRNTL